MSVSKQYEDIITGRLRTELSLGIVCKQQGVDTRLGRGGGTIIRDFIACLEQRNLRLKPRICCELAHADSGTDGTGVYTWRPQKKRLPPKPY